MPAKETSARWFVCWIAALFLPVSVQAAPGIIITNLTAYGATNDLAGMALNVNPTNYDVAVFINVPGAGWYSKPTCPGSPLTTIKADDTWRSLIVNGVNDPTATQLAALLVPTNYSQPCVLGSQFIPTNVYAQAVASAVVRRVNPSQRWISFSGYNWSVKTSGSGTVGPGPNYFSDSTNNVWVDAQGRLHLRMTHRTNQWQCAEILSARSFGHGSYRFEVGSPVNSLNQNVVLGLFTWSDDPVFAYREMDVECSRWGVPTDTNNAQFVLQPYGITNHLVRLRVPPVVTNATFLFTWETNRISWQSQVGSYVANPAASNVIGSYAYTNVTDIPLPGDENVDINLWLNLGNAPTDGQETEVILNSFQFIPLGTPQPAAVSNVSASVSNGFQFTAQVEPDRRYQFLSSSNLLTWQDRGRVLATNIAVRFQDTNFSGNGRGFYRATTLP